jgi:hypothetical protein
MGNFDSLPPLKNMTAKPNDKDQPQKESGQAGAVGGHLRGTWQGYFVADSAACVGPQSYGPRLFALRENHRNQLPL